MNGRRGGSIPDRAKGWLHGAVLLVIYAEIIGKALCAVLLPTPWAVKVMPVSLAARLLPDSHRRRVMENLETVFGETYTEGQRRQIARRYFGQFFVYLLDFFLGVRMKPSDVHKIFVFEGRENVEEALRRGKGIIGVTGHYFRAVRGLLAIGCLGVPLSAVILHAENIPFNKLQGVFRVVLNRVRKRTGVDWIFPGGAVSRVDEKLGNNEPKTRDEAGVRECLEHCSRMLESLIREEPEHWWLWKDLKQFWRPL